MLRRLGTLAVTVALLAGCSYASVEVSASASTDSAPASSSSPGAASGTAAAEASGSAEVAGGTVTETGDITVIATDASGGEATVRVSRGGHAGWDGSAAILTETVNVGMTGDVTRLTFVVDASELGVPIEDVGIFVESFSNETLDLLELDRDPVAQTVTGVFNVSESDMPSVTAAVVDFPGWQALFD
ncbi:hypothetical protein [Demequina sp. NBRC 110054]|uniref:hypothetical protein n=1 Tax=Demequina sp. NBRC 110054 TaxID=1570343 RepID=UPI0009FEAB14|nr:hypothetical protein [Demequina sp. NBRC 110054]